MEGERRGRKGEKKKKKERMKKGRGRKQPEKISLQRKINIL